MDIINNLINKINKSKFLGIVYQIKQAISLYLDLYL